MRFAGLKDYGTFSNSEFVYCIEKETGAGRKVLFRDPNKGDHS